MQNTAQKLPTVVQSRSHAIMFSKRVPSTILGDSARSLVPKTALCIQIIGVRWAWLYATSIARDITTVGNARFQLLLLCYLNSIEQLE